MAWNDEADLRAALQRGGAYLLGAQRADGGFGWPEVQWSDAWTTAECVLGIKASGIDEGVNLGLDWLRANVHDDGGWSSEAYRNVTGGDSDVAGTTYAIRALACCGRTSDRTLIEAGRSWLVSNQRSDGSWGIARADEDRGHIGQTGYAISALARAPAEHRAAEAVQSALYYLYETQRVTGGWGLVPGHEMDPTLTAYALRGIIDAAVLRGQHAQPRVFLRWLANIQHMQGADGSWSDWYGNASSVESAGYCIELGSCLGFTRNEDGSYRDWVQRALRFLADTQRANGGWGISAGEAASAWVTHSVLIALAALLGEQRCIAPHLGVLAAADGGTLRSLGAPRRDRYDFAISFASSQRDFARALALRLQQRGASVFFDAFETENLWGANLIDRFTSVYREGSRLCIMIVSPDYAQRVWPKLERQSAQAHALTADREYILPIRIGPDTDVPGLLETVGYLDANEYDLDEIATLAMAKLGQLGG